MKLKKLLQISYVCFALLNAVNSMFCNNNLNPMRQVMLNNFIDKVLYSGLLVPKNELSKYESNRQGLYLINDCYWLIAQEFYDKSLLIEESETFLKTGKNINFGIDSTGQMVFTYKIISDSKEFVYEDTNIFIKDEKLTKLVSKYKAEVLVDTVDNVVIISHLESRFSVMYSPIAAIESDVIFFSTINEKNPFHKRGIFKSITDIQDKNDVSRILILDDSISIEKLKDVENAINTDFGNESFKRALFSPLQNYIVKLINRGVILSGSKVEGDGDNIFIVNNNERINLTALIYEQLFDNDYGVVSFDQVIFSLSK